MDKLKRM